MNTRIVNGAVVEDIPITDKCNTQLEREARRSTGMKTWEVRHKRSPLIVETTRAKSRIGAIRQVMRQHNRRFECNTTERGWTAMEVAS